MRSVDSFTHRNCGYVRVRQYLRQHSVRYCVYSLQEDKTNIIYRKEKGRLKRLKMGAFLQPPETVYYQQVRSRKRSLHEATARKGRKEPNRTAKRNRKNTVSVTIGRKGNRRTFFVYDRVIYRRQTGWISGFTGQSAYVKDKNDRYIKAPEKAYNQVNLSELKVISHNHNWLTGVLTPIGK